MDYDEVMEKVIDALGDMTNDIFAAWCESQGVESDSDGAYEDFVASDANTAITDAISQVLSDRG
ncbi:MAG: hypothetical protein P8O79_14915 [Halieaceae bacterium]|nr:hypothetical protein [Halieaceae bacterium]